MYGLNKLYLLMEKQHNRGQDGAGIATVKLNVEPGYPFMHRMRSSANQPIADLFQTLGKEIKDLEKYQPIGRLVGNRYSRIGDQFELIRPPSKIPRR